MLDMDSEDHAYEGTTVHSIVTHARAGIFKPNPCYALTSSFPSINGSISPLSSSVRVALLDPHWYVAMEHEFTAL